MDTDTTTPDPMATPAADVTPDAAAPAMDAPSTDAPATDAPAA